jgi:hypothetical protein
MREMKVLYRSRRPDGDCDRALRHARKSETTLSGGFMVQITQFDANGA